MRTGKFKKKLQLEAKPEQGTQIRWLVMSSVSFMGKTRLFKPWMGNLNNGAILKSDSQGPTAGMDTTGLNVHVQGRVKRHRSPCKSKDILVALKWM